MNRDTTETGKSGSDFRAMCDASPLGIFVSDANDACVYTNAAYQRISGLSFDQTRGTDWKASIHRQDRQRVLRDWFSAAQNGSSFQSEFRFLRQDGQMLWTRINSAAMSEVEASCRHVATVEDITARKVAESELRAMATKMTHLAKHDVLTGLPNRALLSERLSLAIGLAQRHHKQVALLFIDLDDFKRVNDSLGHAMGDQLLQSVAQRLTLLVRGSDMVCRQGGDEFVVLLTEIEHARDANLVVETLLAAFEAPHLIGGHRLYVTFSIGISLYPEDGDSMDIVMQNADTAMFHAKVSGRSNYQFFSKEMGQRELRGTNSDKD